MKLDFLPPLTLDVVVRINDHDLGIRVRRVPQSELLGLGVRLPLVRQDLEALEGEDEATRARRLQTLVLERMADDGAALGRAVLLQEARLCRAVVALKVDDGAWEPVTIMPSAMEEDRAANKLWLWSLPAEAHAAVVQALAVLEGGGGPGQAKSGLGVGGLPDAGPHRKAVRDRSRRRA